uniref:Uncharacterized protein n=1 Tax=Rhizophora mucronata TaxID=61149 RepID=A0A2P2PQ27_RHIMU
MCPKLNSKLPQSQEK